MVQIEKGTFNQVVATCSRNKTLGGNVTYLWSMSHKLSKEVWRFIPYRVPAMVDYAPSYDLFNVDVIDSQPEHLISTGATDNVNVHLIPGQYFVKIYEQCSHTNLNPMLSYDVVYEGTATVNYSGQPQNEIVSYTGNTDVFTVYEG